MNAIEDYLARLLTTRFGLAAEDLDVNTTFAELEIDSISLVELAVISGDDFGISLGGDELTKDHTVRTAAELLAGKGARV